MSISRFASTLTWFSIVFALGLSVGSAQESSLQFAKNAKPPAEIATPQNARELALLRKFYDETVWKDERLAQDYERTLVRLWDLFIHQPDKWRVLLTTPVREMIVGAPTDKSEIDWEIFSTSFTKPYSKLTLAS